MCSKQVTTATANIYAVPPRAPVPGIFTLTSCLLVLYMLHLRYRYPYNNFGTTGKLPISLCLFQDIYFWKRLYVSSLV